jgi:hypothetical protein
MAAPAERRIALALSLEAAEKLIEGCEKQTSGAKARSHFQRLGGTSKLVPFPFRVEV